MPLDTFINVHPNPEPKLDGMYEIMINEEQRQIITDALKQYDPMTLNQEVHSELDILKGLFSELKDDEDNYCIQTLPLNIGKRVHVLHGFCL